MGTKAHYERNRVRIREQQRAYYARTKHLPDRKRAIAESVLCFDCNTSIGKLGDNIEGLQRALRYLEKASEKHQ